MKFNARDPQGPSAADKSRTPGQRKTYRIYWVLFLAIALINIVSFSFKGEIAQLVDELRRTYSQFRPGTVDVAPTVRQLPRYEAKPLNVLSAPLAPFSRFYSKLDLQPPYLAQSSVEFSAGDHFVTLAKLVGIGGTDLCLYGADRKFPCGLMGRASLQNRISRSQVLCSPVFYMENDLRYDCVAENGDDLALHQVAQGFARPDALGLPVYGDAANLARSAEAGAWRGNWSIQPLLVLQTSSPETIPANPPDLSESGNRNVGAIREE